MSSGLPGEKYFVLKWKESRKGVGFTRYEVRSTAALEFPEPDYWSVVKSDMDLKEACSLRDELESKEKRGLVVAGEDGCLKQGEPQ